MLIMVKELVHVVYVEDRGRQRRCGAECLSGVGGAARCSAYRARAVQKRCCHIEAVPVLESKS